LDELRGLYNFCWSGDLCILQNNSLIYANAKLALFYDWLAYNPDTDNIMNIGKVWST